MAEKHATHLRDVIEDEIVTGYLKPGDRLDEASLAARFHVSRTPIREALQQLAASGLVELRSHRSAVVSAPDPARLVEMFFVMASLEALCGQLAARRLREEDERALKSSLAACRKAVAKGDPDAYYYENERFHRAIYAASGNRFLAEQTLAMHKRLAPFRRLQLRVRNRLRASLREHEEIVAAILEGKTELAAKLLQSHVAVQGERFSDLMATLGSLGV
jgi:DNA-binding GntR family transcriptional regulator